MLKSKIGRENHYLEFLKSKIWRKNRMKKLFWGNRALEAIEAGEAAEAAEVNVAGEVSNAWKITTEDLRVFKILVFNNLRTLF